MISKPPSERFPLRLRFPSKYSGSAYAGAPSYPWFQDFDFDPFEIVSTANAVSHSEQNVRLGQPEGIIVSRMQRRASLQLGRTALPRRVRRELGRDWPFLGNLNVAVVNYFETAESEQALEREIIVATRSGFSIYPEELVSVLQTAGEQEKGESRLLIQGAAYGDYECPDYTQTEPWYMAIEGLLLNVRQQSRPGIS